MDFTFGDCPSPFYPSLPSSFCTKGNVDLVAPLPVADLPLVRKPAQRLVGNNTPFLQLLGEKKQVDFP